MRPGSGFDMTADTGGIQLCYEPPGAEQACRSLALKLAEVLGYEFLPWDSSPDGLPTL